MSDVMFLLASTSSERRHDLADFFFGPLPTVERVTCRLLTRCQILTSTNNYLCMHPITLAWFHTDLDLFESWNNKRERKKAAMAERAFVDLDVKLMRRLNPVTLVCLHQTVTISF